MSVQSGPTDKRYAANGVTTIYAVPFLVIEASDLKVYLNGVLQTSGYTQTGVGNPTSSITFTAAPLGDLYLVLEVPFQRLVDYQENGDFLSSTVNRDFDRIWQALKQLRNTTSRSPVLGNSDVDGDGWYLAKGNGLRDLRDPVETQDAATKGSMERYVADILETGQGPINNAANVIYVNGDSVATTVQNGILRQFSTIAKMRLKAGVLDREQASVVSLDATTPGDGGGRFYWDAASTEAESENIIAVTGTPIGRWKRIFGYEVDALTTQPVFVEQFLTGFFGRGMRQVETPYAATEQNLTVSATAGGQVINVASTTGYEIGGGLVIKYPSGRYRPHFIKNKSATTLTILPTLYEDVSPTDMVARTWFDEAHPGRFYMRYLAQRVASVTELNGAIATSARTLFTQLDSNPASGFDLLTAIGTAVVSYFDETNDGGGGLIGNPVQRNIGRTAFVTIPAINDGAETQFFSVGGSTAFNFRGVISTQSASSVVTISAVDNNGKIVVVGIIPANLNNTLPQYFDFPFKIMGNATRVKLTITSNIAGDRLVIDQLEVFDTPPFVGKVFTKQRKKIVVLGDSWVAGFLEGSEQREPITQQLAIELPYAKIINAGHGGDTVQALLARFDAEVAPFNPDYVVISTGTNDAANPASGTFYPNSVDYFRLRYFELISKVRAIGARPIIIGVPALAEVRGASIDWEQNNRARTYSRYFYKDFAKNFQDVPDARGRLLWVRDQKPNGTAGGDLTLGAYRTRTLNTVVANEIIGASLASDRVTLPAGTYRFQASCTSFGATNVRLRLQNITGAATLSESINIGYLGSGALSNTLGTFSGQFTLTAVSLVELQIIGSTTRVADGMGQAGSLGTVEVYSDLQIWTK